MNYQKSTSIGQEKEQYSSVQNKQKEVENLSMFFLLNSSYKKVNYFLKCYFICDNEKYFPLDD